MTARELVKKFEKRRQVYTAERDIVDALLYLLRCKAAEEADTELQLNLQTMDEEGN